VQCNLCEYEVTGLSNAYLGCSTARLLHNQSLGMTILIAFAKAKCRCLELGACIASREHMHKRQKTLCRKRHVMRGGDHVMRAEVL
jgi:hypothetical protein